ncbi:hypothetical protein ACTXT7_011042 [Hymenolepis weldensis]
MFQPPLPFKWLEDSEDWALNSEETGEHCESMLKKQRENLRMPVEMIFKSMNRKNEVWDTALPKMSEESLILQVNAFHYVPEANHCTVSVMCLCIILKRIGVLRIAV